MNERSYLQSVENERGEGFSVDIFSNDNKGLAVLVGQFKGGNDVVHVRNLLLAEKDEGLLILDLKQIYKYI